MGDLLSDDQVAAALEELTGWSREGSSLTRSVEAPTFAEGIRLVDEVAVVADELNHHPDIDIRWTTVTFRLSSHSAGGLTENDVTLARRIDQITSP